MTFSASATVTIPATTANLGPGFDCLGAALTLYNRCQFTSLDSPTLQIKVTGVEAAKVSTDSQNLIYQTFVKFYDHIQQTPPGLQLEIDLGYPLARGLGSSATAIVAGLLGANYLAGSPLNQAQIIDLAIAIEGHPDNVVPAILGGCQLSVSDGQGWQICPIAWHQDIVPVVVIPDFELSTQQARAVLPPQIERRDAIFNVAHLGLLLQGLSQNRRDWLTAALADRLHQPYRQHLIPGYTAVEAAAKAAGAYGMVISGAGPTLLALANPQQAKGVQTAMVEAWQQQGIQATGLTLLIDTQGATVIPS